MHLKQTTPPQTDPVWKDPRFSHLHSVWESEAYLVPVFQMEEDGEDIFRVQIFSRTGIIHIPFYDKLAVKEALFPGRLAAEFYPAPGDLRDYAEPGSASKNSVHLYILPEIDEPEYLLHHYYDERMRPIASQGAASPSSISPSSSSEPSRAGDGERRSAPEPQPESTRSPSEDEIFQELLEPGPSPDHAQRSARGHSTKSPLAAALSASYSRYR